MTMAVLVLGGAGYIGSNMVDTLIQNQEEVVVLDNLCTGYRRAVHEKAHFYDGDIRDKALLRHIFETEKIDAVMHFAALTLGRESVEQPLKYFSNNVYGTQIVLEVMQEFKVKPIVFSSSATVYGNTVQATIDEATVTQPLNPYGHSKVMMETMMQDVAQSSDMTFVALRYFNVAGAKKDGALGEVRPRLIPTILQVAQGKIDHLTLYGDDYNTPDGTCIRDYIHVSDLVEAHLLALKYLQNGGQSETFNLGSSKGYSNLEVLEAARKVTGEKIPVDIIPSAVGDAPVLIASSEKIHKILGWQPKSSNIEEIISDAWQWQRQFPNGYDVRS